MFRVTLFTGAVFGLLLLTVLAMPAFGAEWFVSPDGKAENDGTREKPVGFGFGAAAGHEQIKTGRHRVARKGNLHDRHAERRQRLGAFDCL